MIVVNATTVELNTYEQAAAVKLNFPFGQFKTKNVGKYGHKRVEFPTPAIANAWKTRLIQALPENA